MNVYKCKIIYEGDDYQESDLTESMDSYNDIITIKLKGINNITEMSGMFCGCESIKSLPYISKWNTSNVTNMGAIFWGFKSLISFTYISKWDTSNFVDMCDMF